MSVIKLVTNGDGSATFKAVPLSVAVTVGVFLLSTIGAQQTWLWSAATERRALAREVQLDTDSKIDRALSADRAVNSLHFITLDQEVKSLTQRLIAAERQININTGKLEQGAAWRDRR